MVADLEPGRVRGSGPAATCAFDEVLERASNVTATYRAFDENAPVADKLTTYRRMRDPARPQSPCPRGTRDGQRRGRSPPGGSGERFVIQEHHAADCTTLPLERDGVLVSWPCEEPRRPRR